MSLKKMSAMLLLLAAILFGVYTVTPRNKNDGLSEVARVATGQSAWFTSQTHFVVEDQNGHLYELRQMWSNANAYAVYKLVGETNGFH